MAGRLDKNGEKYMEPSSQVRDATALESQIRECFGRIVYTTKTHEKCADACTRKLSHVKVWQIVLSAMTTSGLIAALFVDDTLAYVATVVTAIISMALLALNAYAKDVDPGQVAEKHKKTASSLWDIRESYFKIGRAHV